MISVFSGRSVSSLLCRLALPVLLALSVTNVKAQVGRVYTWGNGLPIPTPELRVPSNVIQTSGNSQIRAALMADGTVWAWGYNTHGELGRGFFGGNENGDIAPAPVPNLSNVVQIVSGGNASYSFHVLKSDGTVWAWGDNSYGQLGDGTFTSSAVPVQVKGLIGVVQIDAVDHTATALKSDGTVWAWGETNFSSYSKTSTPFKVPAVQNIAMIACQYNSIHYLKADGTIWGIGYPLGIQLSKAATNPVQIPALSSIVQISTVNNSFCALDAAGTVWYCGHNKYGQSNNPAAITGPGSDAWQLTPYPSFTGAVQIAMADGCVRALRADGSVWGWGYGSDGELGDGNTGSAASITPPVQALNVANQSYLGKSAIREFSVQAVSQNTVTRSWILTQPYASVVTARLVGKRYTNRLLMQPIGFTVDGVAIGTARTSAAGVATTPLTPAFSAGNHTVVASFAGDKLYNPSSASFILTITKADTTTVATKATLYRGINANLKATLTRNTDGGKPANVEVLFKIDGTVIGSAITDGTGTATLSYTADTTFGVGSHNLTAEFVGDANHNASASANAVVTVNKNKTTLRQGSVSHAPGTRVTLSATLTQSVGKIPQSGKTITFSVDGMVVGTGVTNANGVASYIYRIPSTAAFGNHPLAVSFDEDDYNLAATYNAAVLTVK